MEVLVSGRVQNGPAGRVSRVRNQQTGEVLYQQVTVTLNGRLYFGQLAQSGAENLDLWQDVDFMEVSDLELRWLAASDYEGDDEQFEIASRLRPGDEILLMARLSFDLPRRVAQGQQPRKLFTLRPLRDLAVTAQAQARRRVPIKASK